MSATQKIELLAPGGDVQAIKAAIVAGANAVYCGLDIFNARNRATNLSFEDLTGVLRLAHKYNCEVFLTINVVILEQEMAGLFKLLNKLVNTRIDGIIVQDLGLFKLVKKYFPSLDIHASTQLTTHNAAQILFLKQAGASRVNLSRELNLAEIKKLTSLAHENQVLTEVFVHGSLCIAFSGQCYSSSVSVGNSGNRGRCSQACRDEYEPTKTGNKFPLNLKDNSAYFDLPQLVDAGVDSLKIEGRIKGAHYVYTVVDSWRQNVNQFIETGRLREDDSNLHKVFNRDFTNSFLTGNLSKDMFIDNPRDNSVVHAVNSSNAISVVQVQDVTQTLYNDKQALGATLEDKIKYLSIAKQRITIKFTGALNQPLSVSVTIEENQKNSHAPIKVNSSSVMIKSESSPIDQATLEKRFKIFNNADYEIERFDFESLPDGLSIPFKELSVLRNQVAYHLNGDKQVIAPVELPKLVSHPKLKNNQTSSSATLSILISDEKDFYLANETTADVYFKLPESYKKESPKYSDILKANPKLIPWFPAVLIGKDYIEAVKILEQVKPKKIVSNNTGIAYIANQMGIQWIAGPFLNTTNSYALMTLKEELNCAGAFISNEINRNQIKNIARPENFKMIYSIYHPILMMVSRQCFFQQTVGCKKPTIEDGCMLACKKATTITNVKGVSFAVDKQRGGYPSIYNHEQFLNLDIINDLEHVFDEFFIDLTDIGSGSKEALDKRLLLTHFENALRVDSDLYTDAHAQLNHMVSVKTNAQYSQGL
jgi:putative protease